MAVQTKGFCEYYEKESTGGRMLLQSEKSRGILVEKGKGDSRRSAGTI